MTPAQYTARRWSAMLGVTALVLCALAASGNRPGAVLLAVVVLLLFGVVFAFAERATP